MGWCQAFGPQIRAGCDHAMVADTASCSCPECGVVCPGKFPGCTKVWAAGPQKVTIRRPPREIGRAHGLAVAAATTNGNSASAPALVSAGDGPPPRPIEQPPGADTYGDLRPVLNALRAEVQVLSRKVDQIHSSDPASQATLAAVEAIPDKVASLATRAMRAQHETNVRDLKELWQRIETVLQPDAAVGAVTASQLDARFAWLVSELSERLVFLGNEIARLDSKLSASGPT